MDLVARDLAGRFASDAGALVARAALGLTAFLTVGGLALANGGYFPVSWGWAALGLLWVAVLALLLNAEVRLTRAAWLYLVLLAALVAWTFVSGVWSSSLPRTMLEGERA